MTCPRTRCTIVPAPPRRAARHERVTEITKYFIRFVLFGEEISRIHLAANMLDRDFFIFIDGLSYSILPNIIMLHAFGAGGVGPDDRCLIIVENGRQTRREQIKIFQNFPEPLNAFRTFIGGFHFHLTQTPTGVLFFLTLPNEGTAREKDKMS